MLLGVCSVTAVSPGHWAEETVTVAEAQDQI